MTEESVPGQWQALTLGGVLRLTEDLDVPKNVPFRRPRQSWKRRARETTKRLLEMALVLSIQPNNTFQNILPRG